MDQLRRGRAAAGATSTLGEFSDLTYPLQLVLALIYPVECHSFRMLSHCSTTGHSFEHTSNRATGK